MDLKQAKRLPVTNIKLHFSFGRVAAALVRGHATRARHAIFWRSLVRTARNQVCAAVEAEVRKANPLAWLKSGPERDRPSQPGPGWAVTNRDGTEAPQVSYRALQIEAYIQNRERLDKEGQQLTGHQSDDDGGDGDDGPFR